MDNSYALALMRKTAATIAKTKRPSDDYRFNVWCMAKAMVAKGLGNYDFLGYDPYADKTTWTIKVDNVVKFIDLERSTTYEVNYDRD